MFSPRQATGGQERTCSQGQKRQRGLQVFQIVGTELTVAELHLEHFRLSGHCSRASSDAASARDNGHRMTLTCFQRRDQSARLGSQSRIQAPFIPIHFVRFQFQNLILRLYQLFHGCQNSVRVTEPLVIERLRENECDAEYSDGDVV